MTEPKPVKTAKKKNKKKKRKMTPFLKLIRYVVIGFSCFLLFQVGREVYTTLTLRQQLEEVQERYQEVLDENVYLTTERAKLEDPDYIQSYARGNYMLSKDGEQIFYLPEKENK